MRFEYSLHWRKQRRYRPEITDDLIELCINNSEKIRDREWSDAWNAIAPVPPSGRVLKVVYKERYEEESKVIKILTSYWLE
mgnify:CR=1